MLRQSPHTDGLIKSFEPAVVRIQWIRIEPLALKPCCYAQYVCFYIQTNLYPINRSNIAGKSQLDSISDCLEYFGSFKFQPARAIYCYYQRTRGPVTEWAYCEIPGDRRTY